MDITPRNIAEVDITIPEDFPVESLVQFINSFAQVRSVLSLHEEEVIIRWTSSIAQKMILDVVI